MEYLGLILRWLVWATAGIYMYLVFAVLMFMMVGIGSIINKVKGLKKYETCWFWSKIMKDIWIDEMWHKRPSLNY